MDEGTTVISSADSAVRKSPRTVEIGGGGGLFSGGVYSKQGLSHPHAGTRSKCSVSDPDESPEATVEHELVFVE